MSFLRLLLFLLVLLVVAIPIILAMILLVGVLILPMGLTGFVLAFQENRKYKFFMSRRYLRTRRVNLISSAAISVGVMALIVVYSIMSGFQENLRSAIRGTYSHLMVSSRFPFSPDPLELMDEVAKFDHVTAVAPRLSGVGMLAFTRPGIPDDFNRRGHPDHGGGCGARGPVRRLSPHPEPGGRGHRVPGGESGPAVRTHGVRRTGRAPSTGADHRTAIVRATGRDSRRDGETVLRRLRRGRAAQGPGPTVPGLGRLPQRDVRLRDLDHLHPLRDRPRLLPKRQSTGQGPSSSSPSTTTGTPTW